MSHRLLDGAGGGSCSGLHIITLLGFRDFFTWLFQPGKEQLEVFAAIAIPTIQGLVSLLVWSFFDHYDLQKGWLNLIQNLSSF